MTDTHCSAYTSGLEPTGQRLSFTVPVKDISEESRIIPWDMGGYAVLNIPHRRAMRV
jgi:hypothetical protein